MALDLLLFTFDDISQSDNLEKVNLKIGGILTIAKKFNFFWENFHRKDFGGKNIKNNNQKKIPG